MTFLFLLTDDATKAYHLHDLQSGVLPNDDTQEHDDDDHPWMTTISLDEIVTTHDDSRDATE